MRRVVRKAGQLAFTLFQVLYLRTGFGDQPGEFLFAHGFIRCCGVVELDGVAKAEQGAQQYDEQAGDEPCPCRVRL